MGNAATSRRIFLSYLGLTSGLAAGFGPNAIEVNAQSPAPPTIDAETIAAAERVIGVEFTAEERAQLLRTIEEHRELVSALRAAGPLPNELSPMTTFRARLPGRPVTRVTTGRPTRTVVDPPALPSSDADIAFAPLTTLAGWIERRALTSERLTSIYLARLERLNPTLLCAITITRDRAMADARRADAEIASGHYRGPLHGIPYGLKDIIDTKGIATTRGAEPWRDRVPDRDAVVTARLAEAGAVLVAKTAVGALAYGDIWFGGTCKSPWNASKGSSGSSAGSASGVSAGLFGFAIGTETLGSIVSPCERCGAAGLRPTFGRVARTGAMALVWTMDKIGPICRSIADTALVLDVINGADDGDPSSVSEAFEWSPEPSVRGLRVGVDPRWLRDDPYAATTKAAVEAARAEGCEIVDLASPDIDARPALIPLYAEAAAAFDELTRANLDDQLSWQADEAWPNTFRRSHFLSATDLVHADRLRRRLCESMHAHFERVDCVLAPPFGGGMLVLTNSSGHPCAIFRAGFDANNQPRSMTVMGRLFDEGTILRVATALERRLGAAERRPPQMS
ncbi:MAG: amidase [Phycisphaerae bacterium]|nr:amidase [Phycisphaerae bacterium]